MLELGVLLKALLHCVTVRHHCLPWSDIAPIVFDFLGRADIPNYRALCSDAGCQKFTRCLQVPSGLACPMAWVAGNVLFLTLHNKLELTDPRSRQTVAKLTGPTEDILHFRGLPSRPEFIAFTSENERTFQFELHVMAIGPGNELVVTRRLPISAPCDRVAASGNSVAVSSNSGKVGVWDGLHTGEWRERWVMSTEDDFRGVALAPSGALVTANGSRNRVELRCGNTGALLHSEPCLCVQVEPEPEELETPEGRLACSPFASAPERDSVQDVAVDAAGNVLLCTGPTHPAIYVYEPTLTGPPKEICLGAAAQPLWAIEVNGPTVLVGSSNCFYAIHA